MRISNPKVAQKTLFEEMEVSMYVVLGHGSVVAEMLVFPLNSGLHVFEGTTLNLGSQQAENDSEAQQS